MINLYISLLRLIGALCLAKEGDLWVNKNQSSLIYSGKTFAVRVPLNLLYTEVFATHRDLAN